MLCKEHVSVGAPAAGARGRAGWGAHRRDAAPHRTRGAGVRRAPAPATAIGNGPKLLAVTLPISLQFIVSCACYTVMWPCNASVIAVSHFSGSRSLAVPDAVGACSRRSTSTHALDARRSHPSAYSSTLRYSCMFFCSLVKFNTIFQISLFDRIVSFL